MTDFEMELAAIDDEEREQDALDRESDDLSAARAIVTASLISIPFWALVAWVWI